MNIIDTIDALGDHMGEPRAPRPEYVERYVRKVDLTALTPQEREWMREAEEADAEVDAFIRARRQS